MTLFEILKTANCSQKFKRKDWYVGYCYVSDMDFTLMRNFGTEDGDEHCSFVPDLIADDWEFIE